MGRMALRGQSDLLVAVNLRVQPGRSLMSMNACLLLQNEDGICKCSLKRCFIKMMNKNE